MKETKVHKKQRIKRSAEMPGTSSSRMKIWMRQTRKTDLQSRVMVLMLFTIVRGHVISRCTFM
jgi:hypothetical protein